MGGRTLATAGPPRNAPVECYYAQRRSSANLEMMRPGIDLHPHLHFHINFPSSSPSSSPCHARAHLLLRRSLHFPCPLQRRTHHSAVARRDAPSHTPLPLSGFAVVLSEAGTQFPDRICVTIIADHAPWVMGGVFITPAVRVHSQPELTVTSSSCPDFSWPRRNAKTRPTKYDLHHLRPPQNPLRRPVMRQLSPGGRERQATS
ncbi:hypothetical protein EDB80DRAFT_377305 [Ilyonectria destructans]|nr:hypothetical protein EDB80DRAFT_377305 [Ilyonectria destructans]